MLVWFHCNRLLSTLIAGVTFCHGRCFGGSSTSHSSPLGLATSMPRAMKQDKRAQQAMMIARKTSSSCSNDMADKVFDTYCAYLLRRYEKILSLSPAINKGTSDNGLEATTFSTRPGLEIKPNPTGIDIDMAGSASIAFDITAVARLQNVTT